MGPCNWDVDPSTLGVCSGWSGYSAAVQSAALDLASTFLWGATGRRYGLCPITVRPAQDRDNLPEAYRDYPLWPGQDPAVSSPYVYNGTWRNSGCGCGPRCCCRPQCAVVLRGPVASITEVLVDGDVVPSSSYRVDLTQGAYYLVRLDGTCWPTCQDFQTDEGAAGSFSVEYVVGLALPSSLELATAMLACEYGKYLTSGSCALPAKMTRLSRQGVEVEVEPPAPDEGKTGIKIVDDIVATLNPSRRKSPITIMSPDVDEACDRVVVVATGGS